MSLLFDGPHCPHRISEWVSVSSSPHLPSSICCSSLPTLSSSTRFCLLSLKNYIHGNINSPYFFCLRWLPISSHVTSHTFVWEICREFLINSWGIHLQVEKRPIKVTENGFYVWLWSVRWRNWLQKIREKKNPTQFYLFNKGRKNNGFLFQIFYGKLYYMLSKERTFASKKLQKSHHFRAKAEPGLSI